MFEGTLEFELRIYIGGFSLLQKILQRKGVSDLRINLGWAESERNLMKRS